MPKKKVEAKKKRRCKDKKKPFEDKKSFTLTSPHPQEEEIEQVEDLSGMVEVGQWNEEIWPVTRNNRSTPTMDNSLLWECCLPGILHLKHQMFVL